MMRLLCALVLAAGCGSSAPADVAGDYTVAVTNGANGCAFQNWMEGAMNPNVPVTITQSDEHITASVGGFAQLVLDAGFGRHDFVGTITGNRLQLTIDGSQQEMTMNMCVFHYLGMLDATSSGDFLSGTIDYTTATNGHADCGSLEGCVSE